MKIHATAVVSPGAELGKNVEIGAYSIIGANVRVGAETNIGAHVVIDGHTEMGERNRVHSFATLGVTPQDLKYRGEPTRLVIGTDNTFREYVNASIGTVTGGGVTTIGDHNLIMANVHIAHDCHVGSHIILSNAATLGGHVTVGDCSIVGAFSGVHQFCRIGDHAFIGGYSVVTKDALPFVKTVGNRARVYGVNSVGLRRQGFDEAAIERIRQAYRILFQSKLNTSQAVAALKEAAASLPEAEIFVRFIEGSRRGVVKR